MHETLEEVQMRSRKLIDGNVKVYLSLFSLVAVLLLGERSQLLAIIVFSALSLYAERRAYFKILKVPILFLLAGIVVLLLTIGGNVVFNVWIFSISDNGLRVARSVVLRSLSSVAILSFLVITTSIPEFVSSLSKLRIPSFITEMLLLVYRAIQVLLDEVSRLDVAASSRNGYSSFANTVRTTSMLAFSSFIRSVRRSEIMDEAMSSRCYSGKYPILEPENGGIVFAVLIVAAIILAGCWG